MSPPWLLKVSTATVRSEFLPAQIAEYLWLDVTPCPPCGAQIDQFVAPWMVKPAELG